MTSRFGAQFMVALLLGACSGGGGDDPTVPASPAPAPVAPAPLVAPVVNDPLAGPLPPAPPPAEGAYLSGRIVRQAMEAGDGIAKAARGVSSEPLPQQRVILGMIAYDPSTLGT